MPETPDHGTPSPPARSRGRLVLVVAAVIAAGLGSRAIPDPPAWVRDWLGDALWAAMVFVLVAIAIPRAPTRRIAVLAFTVSTLVEVSQLYQAEWIRRLRQNRLAALALGHGFLWADLVAYAAGIAVAATIDGVLRAQSRGR